MNNQNSRASLLSRMFMTMETMTMEARAEGMSPKDIMLVLTTARDMIEVRLNEPCNNHATMVDGPGCG